MLLYKAAFEHEGFKLAVGENDIEIIDVFDHLAHFYRMIMLGAEILADSVLSAFALPTYIISELLFSSDRRRGSTEAASPFCEAP